VSRTWVKRWNPDAYWRETTDFLAYREDLAHKVVTLVAEWRAQRNEISKARKNLAFLCERLDMLVVESGLALPVPEAEGGDIDLVADDLGDFLSILPKTDCWDRHPGFYQGDEDRPEVCEGCPFEKPVKGLSGSHQYYACDTLAFIGEKIVDWRVGYPADPWPEPGVWFSWFESDRSKH
jgi:hypothetical protein